MALMLLLFPFILELELSALISLLRDKNLPSILFRELSNKFWLSCISFLLLIKKLFNLLMFAELLFILFFKANGS